MPSPSPSRPLALFSALALAISACSGRGRSDAMVEDLVEPPALDSSLDGGGSRFDSSLDGDARPLADARSLTDARATTDARPRTDASRGDALGPIEGIEGAAGTEFLATYTANTVLNEAFSFGVMLGNPSEFPTDVRITGGALTRPIARTLAPRSSEMVPLPAVAMLRLARGTNAPGMSPTGTSVLSRGAAYRIEASDPIIAQQFNPTTYAVGSMYSFTNDASLLLPTRVLGTDYIAVTQPNFRSNNTSVFGGFITVVAPGPETARVSLELTAGVRAGSGVEGSLAGPRTFTLPPGAVLQLIADGNNDDFTGSRIHSDHPVAVFVGHDCTNIPADTPSCDHLEEQLLPLPMWGRRYAVTAFREPASPADRRYRVRIVSASPALALAFQNVAPPASCARPLAEGAFCEFDTSVNFVVSGSGPFLVMQFMLGLGMPTGHCCDDPPSCGRPARYPECQGDPDMVTEIPTERFLSGYPFFVPDTYVHTFINVVAEHPGELMLDGEPLPEGTDEPVGDGYRVRVLPVVPGGHILTSPAEQQFGLKIYGLAPHTSYGLPGGVRTE